MRSAIIGAILVLATSAAAETRYPELDPATMTPPQRAMYDALMTGPRHSIEGPFNTWLRSPELEQVRHDWNQSCGEDAR